MSGQVVDEPDRLRLSFGREETAFARAERRAEIVVGGGFVLAAVALAFATAGRGTASPAVASMYVLMLAVAGRVRFDVGAGFTVPTQIVFVPMLFALPVGQVPLLVAVALGLGALPEVASGKTPAERAFVCFANSWFAIGPALVLAFGATHSPRVSVALLVTALIAQVAGDFCANAVRERLRSGISVRELADEMSLIYLIDVALSPVGLVVAFAALHRTWAVLLMLPLLGILAVFSRERRARLDQLIELNDAYRGTALVLGDVVESDDAYTGEHCKGVVELALAVAAEMRLAAHQRRCIEFGALLHDVGKLAVPKEIINKPGALDEREWSIIRLHTIEGQRLLERVGGIMREVGAIVRSSHERWDGDGYPDGLRGEAIPLEARIVSACDAYNAMTTTRSYRPAMSHGEALAELRRNAGTQFDPAVVDALLRVVADKAQDRRAA